MEKCKFKDLYIFRKLSEHFQKVKCTYIFNVFITAVQGLKNVSQKVWKEWIKQSRCHLFKIWWKNDLVVQLHVNFSKNIWTLPKSCMHNFNVSIAAVQGVKNVSQKVWKEFFTQSRWHLFKTWWKNDQVQRHVIFKKNVWTLPKSHMHHLQCVHNNSARFKRCQSKGVKGVDYTK
jgi:hypothetical protein